MDDTNNGKKCLSFQMQIGLTRDQINVEGELTLASLKEIACSFVDRKFPEHGFYSLVDKILLFRHDNNSPNILQHISSPTDVKDGCLVEIVLSENVDACILRCKSRTHKKTQSTQTTMEDLDQTQ